jgi:hypothetical protein
VGNAIKLRLLCQITIPFGIIRWLRWRVGGDKGNWDMVRENGKRWGKLSDNINYNQQMRITAVLPNPIELMVYDYDSVGSDDLAAVIL